MDIRAVSLLHVLTLFPRQGKQQNGQQGKRYRVEMGLVAINGRKSCMRFPAATPYKINYKNLCRSKKREKREKAEWTGREW